MLISIPDTVSHYGRIGPGEVRTLFIPDLAAGQIVVECKPEETVRLNLSRARFMSLTVKGSALILPLTDDEGATLASWKVPTFETITVEGHLGLPEIFAVKHLYVGGYLSGTGTRLQVNGLQVEKSVKLEQKTYADYSSLNPRDAELNVTHSLLVNNDLEVGGTLHSTAHEMRVGGNLTVKVLKELSGSSPQVGGHATISTGALLFRSMNVQGVLHCPKLVAGADPEWDGSRHLLNCGTLSADSTVTGLDVCTHAQAMLPV